MSLLSVKSQHHRGKERTPRKEMWGDAMESDQGTLRNLEDQDTWHIYGGLRTTCKSRFLSFYPLGSRDKTWVVLLSGKLLHLLIQLTIFLVSFWPKTTLVSLFNCSCCGREFASLLRSAHQCPDCWLYCSTCTIVSLGLNFKNYLGNSLMKISKMQRVSSLWSTKMRKGSWTKWNTTIRCSPSQPGSHTCFHSYEMKRYLNISKWFAKALEVCSITMTNEVYKPSSYISTAYQSNVFSLAKHP